MDCRMIAPETIAAVSEKFPAVRWSEFAAQHRAVVPHGVLAEAFRYLHDERGFDLLVDVTCVDYLNYRGAEDRFGMVYLLTNTKTNERVTLRVFLNEPDLSVPSACAVWA